MPPVHAAAGNIHVVPDVAHPVETQPHLPETHPSNPGAGQSIRTPQETVPAIRAPMYAAGSPGATRAGPGAALPDAYVGTPAGDLHADPRHAGVVIDEAGQPYVAASNHYYAVRNDATNGTWRAVQLQDPAKPGIPIRQDRSGDWMPDAEVGLRGGSPDDSRLMMMRQDLERRRGELNRELTSLTSSERVARQLIASLDSVMGFCEGQLNDLRAHGADDRSAAAHVAQLRADLADAQNSLREVTNQQYATIGTLRDVEQQLSHLPLGGM